MRACWPLSTTAPVSASRKDDARPPRRGRASSTVTWVPRSASSTAAARPAKPPPMTTTSTMSGQKLGAAPGGQRQADALVARERDALVEDVEPARLDAREQPLVDEAHGLGRRHGAAILWRQRAARAQVEGARPAALEPPERPHARRVAAREHLVLGAAEARQVLQRQVETAPGGVLAYVAQDVGELERDPEIARVVGRAGAVMPEDLDAQQPDGGRDEVAVLLELVEGPVAPARQVHRDPADEIREVALREREPAHGVGQRDADRMRRRAVVDAVELVAPASEQRRRIALPRLEAVRDVVDEAAEGVHRVQRRAAFGSEQPERLREAAAAATQDRVAVRVRLAECGLAHAARSAAACRA